MRLIDADRLIRRWCGMKCGCERDECGREIEPCIVVMAIEEAPTINRPQGEWISDASSPIAYRCTVCNTLQHWSVIQNGRYKFCPMCGARMKGADDD